MNREERFEELLTLFVDGELSAADEEEFERLLAANPEWRRRAEEERRMAEMIRSIPRASAPDGLLSSSLAKAQQEEDEAPAKIIEVEERPRPGRLLFYLSGVAAVLVAGVLAYTSFLDEPEEPQVAMVAKKAAKAPASAASELRHSGTSVQSEPGIAGNPAQQKSSASAPTSTEMDFFAGYGTTSRGDIVPMEPLQEAIAADRVESASAEESLRYSYDASAELEDEGVNWSMEEAPAAAQPIAPMAYGESFESGSANPFASASSPVEEQKPGFFAGLFEAGTGEVSAFGALADQPVMLGTFLYSMEQHGGVAIAAGRELADDYDSAGTVRTDRGRAYYFRDESLNLEQPPPATRRELNEELEFRIPSRQKEGLATVPQRGAVAQDRWGSAMMPITDGMMGFWFESEDQAREAVRQYPATVKLTSGTLLLRQAEITPEEKGVRLGIPFKRATPSPTPNP